MKRSMRWPRRDFLKVAGAGSVAAAAGTLLPRPMAALPRSAGRTVVSVLDPMIIINGTDVHTLAMRALDAAKAAGASYADVRLTRQLTQSFSGLTFGTPNFLVENETVGVGVRAWVHGAWGFAASPYWDPEEVVRLAREAARQATTNAKSVSRPVEWAPIPVASGAWATPIKVDPFVLSLEEKGDLMASWCQPASRYRYCVCTFNANFTRQEQAVATTDGAYFTQTLYQSGGQFDVQRETIYGPQRFGQATATGLANTAAGWELLTEANIPAQIPQLHEEADPTKPGLPVKPGDIGRYDVVFDAATMADFVDNTIGTAAQVDLALGYEANNIGTSYLGPDPFAFLGSYQAASPLVTITGDRSMPRGLATVKWDDEGVVPEDFTFIKDGVLVDYQTTREQAEWLARWYQKQGKPVRSHGCAAAQDATFITMQHMPNLVLQPGAHDASFDDLVADTKKGLAVIRGNILQIDMQFRTGFGGGQIREIVDGKLGAAVSGLSFLFSTTELWKNVKALGGAKSAVQIPSFDRKGQPIQSTAHSVRAVPAKVANVDFIDPRRKA